MAAGLARLEVIATASRPASADWCRSLGAAHIVDHNGDILDVRAYTVGATVNYLGISKASGIGYGLGPYTGNAIQSFGNIQDYACLAVPSICQGTGGGGGSGSAK